MKIKKIDPEEISGKSLGFKEYRKNLKPALKAMITQHPSQEESTKFFIKTNFEFSDMPNKKLGLLIVGDHTAAWLKMVKEELKSDKKNTCMGDCFVKSNPAGGYILTLLPIKGAAKKNLMLKQLLKSALKSTPFSIEIGAGGELEEDKAEDAQVEEVDVDDSDEIEAEVAATSTTTIAAVPQVELDAIRSSYQKVKELMKQLA